MKYLLLFVIISIVLTANIRQRISYEYNFENFKRKYNKEYNSPEEHIYRLQVFANNLDKIDEHNSLDSSYKMGINKFGDLTDSEFESFLTLGRKPYKDLSTKTETKNIKDLPESIDWVELGAVAHIKDQAACGSCWAFSVAAGVEGLNYIKTKKLVTLSEQQLVDCSTSYGNYGCNGGLERQGYEYVKDHGLCSDEEYPYLAIDGKCKDCKPIVKTNGWLQIQRGESFLQESVANQPTSIAIFATPIQFYKSGIFNDECPSHPTYLNHAVLGVGYGIEKDVKFWKIRNSWGEGWGEKGYIRLLKDYKYTDGLCGIGIDNTAPTME